MVTNCALVNLKRIDGNLGSLTAIEGGESIPFDIRRVYYITRVPENVTRGFHSHRKLKQVLLCLNGNVKIRVKTPFEEEVIALTDNSKGLFIGHMVWREMFDFSPGAVLMVLASEHYTEDDYIRDYDSYIAEANTYFMREKGQ